MKRGETEKLQYDFNTAAVLEVYMQSLDNWYRTTAKEFRSFNGPRRITQPTKIIKGDPDVHMKTYEYVGPVYQYGTNIQVEYIGTGSVASSKVLEDNLKISKDRS